MPKSANYKGLANKVYEFIKANSPEAERLNKEYVLTKEQDRPKKFPGKIVREIKAKVFSKLSFSKHADLWHQVDAKKIQRDQRNKHHTTKTKRLKLVL